MPDDHPAPMAVPMSTCDGLAGRPPPLAEHRQVGKFWNGTMGRCRLFLQPGVMCRVLVHGRTPTVDRCHAQFVVPGLVAVDLAQAIALAVLGEPLRGIER